MLDEFRESDWATFHRREPFRMIRVNNGGRIFDEGKNRHHFKSTALERMPKVRQSKSS